MKYFYVQKWCHNGARAVITKYEQKSQWVGARIVDTKFIYCQNFFKRLGAVTKGEQKRYIFLKRHVEKSGDEDVKIEDENLQLL